jgi:serine/threonine protein kinase
MSMICKVMGTPAVEEWGEFHAKAKEKNWSLPNAPPKFPGMWGGVEPELVDLLGKMLQMNPEKRASARDLIGHPYFNRIATQIRNICAVHE